ncbi:MAG: single-stranded-DNA-specific exonuclease RecJ [Armatimonadetes bacterium]|nr:single-stranded-DNA-specific exonuclease RecJ [Armatimonadota bacterium]
MRTPSTPLRWRVAERVPEKLAARFAHLPPVTVQLLYNRGLLSANGRAEEAVEAFLHPDYRLHLHNPYKLKDMDKAVARLRQAIERGEKIGVFGHYDVDGITSAVLLYEALRRLGADAYPHLPHRTEEYGLNLVGLQDLKERGVSLVVSVDCGIKSIPEAQAAREMAIDVIVTDHHEVEQEETPGKESEDVVPEAVAVINPKQRRCAYPFQGLTGVGIAYKLAEALFLDAWQAPYPGRPSQEESDRNFLKWLFELVAIGTVGDVAELMEENRIFVQWGLKVLAKTRRPGLKCLYQVAGIDPAKISAYGIGYWIAPRLNASGRLESARISLDLLMTQDEAEAHALARRLQELNSQRQQLIEALMAHLRVQAQACLSQKVLVLPQQGWPSGIVGLAAGRLCEEFHRPVLVVDWGEETCTGSARSIPAFHIARALAECSDVLLRHGGHSQAAGFAMSSASLAPLREKMNLLAEAHLSDEDLIPTLDIEARLSPEELGQELLDWLNRFEPTGCGNPRPVFQITGRLAYIRSCGENKATLQFGLEKPASPPISGVAFGQGQRVAEFQPGDLIEVAGTVELNEYNGSRKVQIRAADLRHAAD